jgi:PAS domain S-box-containing protein
MNKTHREKNRREPPIPEGDSVARQLAELEAYYDTAPVGLCVLDTDLRYVRLNERLAEINGVPIDEHLGRTVREVLPEIADRVEPLLMRVIETGEPLRDVEITTEAHPPFVGEWTRVENWYPMIAASGEVFGVNVVVEDVTEHKRIEAKLARLNAELEERVAARTTELRLEIAERQRLEAEIVDISEHVQSRIGQDLHDDLGQQLSALAMLASALERSLAREGHPKTEAVTQMSQILKNAVNTTRNLAKGLYPIELDKGGLSVALEDLARSTAAAAGVECAARCKAEFLLAAPAAIHLYRIVQEAISNALKHGQPKRIEIECALLGGVPTLTVSNDGLPFKKPRGRRRGLGLRILEYRARLLGAEITIEPGRNGGCQLVCALQGEVARTRG